ncbi:FERM and PDZ domain-containing protein 4-like [Nematolebias whitei]|uniref:FERM and PDZ domain-containing protein 4-like n=1 Tax=Nematolebias whitei TaxID=451745 RepID=UPI00189C1651|nr:FERM and PDZ domain-containing protein 4-like [Nematolebias whitei]
MNNTRDARDFLTSQGSQSSSLEEVHLDGIPPAPRLVEMRRDPVLGFGFVAGSEKPVVVRSVTPGGPSEGKLLPGDEIIMINDEAVGSAPRERVIDLVRYLNSPRSCKESILLTVVQPYPSPKSAFISAAKKAMLKSNPVKVRFAEEVIINGQVPNPVKDNSLLFMPNVLKVYLENGQTKSFRFDSSTSIKEVILTLQEKLSIRCIEHFSLVLEEKTEGSGSKLLLLHEQEMLTQVTQRPGSNKMKCFFRISFMPRDPVELLRRDPVAFEYLYVQCCNDVVLERFGPELKYDAALRLAALQMYIISMATRQSQKVSLKYIQKEWGLSLFLPPTVLSSMKEKNIKKALTHILKTNQNLVPPGKKLTALQAKVHYLRYISELKLYGGREFTSILLQCEKQTEVMLLVGPRYGISHVINARTNLVALLADFSHVNRIEILTEDETSVRLELHVLDVRPITLIMEASDAMNLACLTAGYYRLLVDSRRSIFNVAHSNSTGEDDAGQDRVLEWPYSTSMGNNEEPTQCEVYDRDSSNNGQRENSISPYFPKAPNLESDLGMRRSPVPPPLPPSTRHKTQDSPRSAKVSFIFGGNPPLNRPKNYDIVPESPESSDPFQFDLTHVYSNIITEEGGEEPLLRDLFDPDTTDDAEDDDEASCEEDSTGGTPVSDNAQGRDADCDNQRGKATFLTMSGSTDDIIDLTSLPPPEGDDGVDDDEDDTLLQTLNLAIAAPPPDFQDSAEEDTAPEGRPLSTRDNDDMPVSLIDAVPTHGEGEGSRGGERRLENAVMNTLQALEDLSVSEQRPPPPPPNRNNTGVYTSQGFSPASSSDSGNETNSSEMTEICELAATHRLNESHMRLLVATREGYQPLLEEKTEFPVSPNSCNATNKKNHSPTRSLHPPAVPPRKSPQLDATLSGQDRLEVKPQTSLSLTLQRPSSTTLGLKHHKKSADSSGKYNTFSTREVHRGESSSRRNYLDLNQRSAFSEQDENQGRQNSFMAECSAAESMGVNSLPREHCRNLRPSSIVSDHFSDVGNMGDCASDNGATAAEQDEHLVVASLLSPSRKSRSSDQGSDTQSDHQTISRQQSVARLCEYHLAKRISNLQGEAHSSLQGSLCSSLDAGGSTNSSACATPTDSPLGPGAVQSKHPRLQKHPLSSSSSSLLRAVNCEDKPGIPLGFPGQSTQGKDPHPHADPALLRKMLPNIHPPLAGMESNRPSSSTPSKHKDMAGIGNKKLHNDIHAKQACFKGLNPKEGSEAYKQLINYLTVSQMHQGGKLHSAGMGGAVKKDTRRFITSNPQLVEMVKNRGNATARCQCTPSTTSSPFVSPNIVTPHSTTLQVATKNPQSYHSATLPAKLKRSPDMHAQRRNEGLDFRKATSERRSSFSGLENELGGSGMDPEHFLSLYKKQDCNTRDGAFNSSQNFEGTNNRPPPRSRSQPSSSTEDWFKSDLRSVHQTHLCPNDSFCISAAPSLSGQRADLSAMSLGRGDHPSAFVRQSSNSIRANVSSPGPNAQYPPPPPPPPPPPLPSQANSISSNSVCLQDPLNSSQFRQNHIQTVMPTLSQMDSFSSSMQRGRELKRSSSNVTPSSGSVEVLFDKPTRSRSQQPLSVPMSQQGDTKVQRRPTRKRLSKSYSQGSVSSHTTCWSTGSRVDSRRASVAFPLQKDSKHMKGSQKLDTSPWRCNGPFSYCFFKRKSEGEEDDTEWERPRRIRGGVSFDNNVTVTSSASPCGSVIDAAGEQLYGEVLNNMSFSDRLARINALKDHMYTFPSGFNDVRRDASELIALVRSSIGRCDRGIQMPIQDVSQYKQLLSVESKELGRACRRMAQAHSSPDEMLLAVTCSFQVLCCLCEACMCLVRGLGASATHQQREVVAKVDEVVMNYICLLKAAEAATVGAPGEHSVKALVRHSSTMSAIANALTRSLKTLLSK